MLKVCEWYTSLSGNVTMWHKPIPSASHSIYFDSTDKLAWISFFFLFFWFVFPHDIADLALFLYKNWIVFAAGIADCNVQNRVYDKHSRISQGLHCRNLEYLRICFSFFKMLLRQMKHGNIANCARNLHVVCMQNSQKEPNTKSKSSCYLNGHQ